MNIKKEESEKPFDLEERTFLFAKDVSLYCRRLPKTVSNREYARQVIRASGSVGANYREANDPLGEKDFKMRIKISRKESKESAYWLRLVIETNDDEHKEEGLKLKDEAVELTKIFSSILTKV